jgi:hypothetical protein
MPSPSSVLPWHGAGGHGDVTAEIQRVGRIRRARPSVVVDVGDLRFQFAEQDAEAAEQPRLDARLRPVACRHGTHVADDQAEVLVGEVGEHPGRHHPHAAPILADAPTDHALQFGIAVVARDVREVPCNDARQPWLVHDHRTFHEGAVAACAATSVRKPLALSVAFGGGCRSEGRRRQRVPLIEDAL